MKNERRKKTYPEQGVKESCFFGYQMDLAFYRVGVKVSAISSLKGGYWYFVNKCETNVYL